MYVCISCIIERQRKKDQSIRHDIPGEKERERKKAKKSPHKGRLDMQEGQTVGRSVERKEGRMVNSEKEEELLLPSVCCC